MSTMASTVMRGSLIISLFLSVLGHTPHAVKARLGFFPPTFLNSRSSLKLSSASPQSRPYSLFHESPISQRRQLDARIGLRQRTSRLPVLLASAATSPETVPVTLLSGFLGTGKTTVLKHILENNEGLKVGVVVNDVAEVNIDAKLVRDTNSVAGSDTVELQNGCACCSASEGLFSSVEQILELGRSRGEPFKHVIIELSGVAEPAVVKENFEDAANQGLPIAKEVEIDNVVTVVDTSSFVDEWMTQDLIGERSDISGKEPGCSGRRPVAEFLAEQVEAADRVVLNKIDMASSKERETAAAVVQGLLKSNGRDKPFEVVESTYGKVPLSIVLPDRATAAPIEPASTCAKKKCSDSECEEHGHAHTHKSEEKCSDPECGDPTCEEHGHAHTHSRDTSAKARLGIDSFVYRARRPFDEDRLFKLIDSWPIPSKNLSVYLTAIVTGDMEIESQSPLQPVVRSKGFLWIAGNPRQQLYWSHAGRHFALEPAGKWWADLPPRHLERAQQDIPAEWERVQREEFEGEFGDRRQELVFIGAGMSQEDICAALDKCLVDDEEMPKFRKHLEASIELEAKARYAVGDKVQCKLQDWEYGTVVQVGYRELDWPMSKPDAPYQVQLANGALIWVPEDTDDVIRDR